MYDAKQLRELATLAGVSVPESDETLLNCMGSVLSSVIRQLKPIFDMERSYSHQLGEMARLSDVVCGFLVQEAERLEFPFSPPQNIPVHVLAAAGEIMQYVEAVRPGEGEKETKWVLHIIGPDDVISCVGEFDALRKANQHNVAFAKMMSNDSSPNDPYCVAVAELV